MKKIFTTIFACMLALSMFAQKDIIHNYVDGNMTKTAFVEQMTEHFQVYELDRQQTLKLNALLQKKAENYAVIREMKGNKKKFKAKMNSQHEHMIQSMRYILAPEQYRDYMMAVRVEYAEERAAQKK